MIDKSYFNLIVKTDVLSCQLNTTQYLERLMAWINGYKKLFGYTESSCNANLSRGETNIQTYMNRNFSKNHRQRFFCLFIKIMSNSKVSILRRRGRAR